MVNEDDDDAAAVENAHPAAPPAAVDPPAPPPDNDPAVPPVIICKECDCSNVATSTQCQYCMHPFPPSADPILPQIEHQSNDNNVLYLGYCVHDLFGTISKRDVTAITSNIIDNPLPLPLPRGIAALAEKAVGVDKDDFIQSPQHNIFDKGLPTAATTTSRDPIGFWEKETLAAAARVRIWGSMTSFPFPKFSMAGNDFADVALCKRRRLF